MFILLVKLGVAFSQWWWLTLIFLLILLVEQWWFEYDFIAKNGLTLTARVGGNIDSQGGGYVDCWVYRTSGWTVVMYMLLLDCDVFTNMCSIIASVLGDVYCLFCCVFAICVRSNGMSLSVGVWLGRKAHPSVLGDVYCLFCCVFAICVRSNGMSLSVGVWLGRKAHPSVLGDVYCLFCCVFAICVRSNGMSLSVGVWLGRKAHPSVLGDVYCLFCCVFAICVRSNGVSLSVGVWLGMKAHPSVLGDVYCLFCCVFAICVWSNGVSLSVGVWLGRKAHPQDLTVLSNITDESNFDDRPSRGRWYVLVTCMLLPFFLMSLSTAMINVIIFTQVTYFHIYMSSLRPVIPGLPFLVKQHFGPSLCLVSQSHCVWWLDKILFSLGTSLCPRIAPLDEV